MGRFVILNAFLLGLIGAVSSQGIFVDKSYNRPIYPTDPEGCGTISINALKACPAQMECWKDTNFPNGARCECNTLWFTVPAKLPFDNSEWDDGFTADDCENLHVPRFITSSWYLLNLVVFLAFIYTDFVVIRELYRAKALRRNATTYCLLYMMWMAIPLAGYQIIYILGLWDVDKNEYWYQNRHPFAWFGFWPANVLVDFEIGVTWIDLVDRTKKMSKSSSRTLKILRYVLRFFAFSQALFFIVFNNYLSGSLIGYLVTAVMPSVNGMIFVGIGGKLILRTLCPDKKDVSNPNYKVAQSITRAVYHTVGAKFTEVLVLFGMGVSARHPTLGYMYGYLSVVFWSAFAFRLWAWLHYLIYGSRKHLKAFENDSASSYFGFSTIGLNKTLTTASSKASSALGTVSTQCAPPDDEKD